MINYYDLRLILDLLVSYPANGGLSVVRRFVCLIRIRRDVQFAMVGI